MFCECWTLALVHFVLDSDLHGTFVPCSYGIRSQAVLLLGHFAQEDTYFLQPDQLPVVARTLAHFTGVKFSCLYRLFQSNESMYLARGDY